jgi:hypothetical protein
VKHVRLPPHVTVLLIRQEIDMMWHCVMQLLET